MGIRTIARPRGVTTPGLVPAAARTAELLSPEEIGLSGEGIELFAKAVGGRQQLAEVLSVAGTSADVEQIATLLLDPRYTKVSLRKLCAFANITVVDLFTVYRKAMMARAHIEATHLIASKLGPVVEDVMNRAAPQRQTCPTCQGAAKGTALCLTCRGSGEVQTEPDLERQRLALELGQLTQKAAGVLVQQNTINAGGFNAAGTGSLEQLHQAVGDLLFNPARRRTGAPTIEIDTIDAEPTPGIPDAEPSLIPDDDDRDDRDPADDASGSDYSADSDSDTPLSDESGDATQDTPDP